MDRRITEFVRGLRAAGVRVSVAEATEAAEAARAVGLADREAFRRALSASTVKARDDQAAFEALFPLYFGSGGPPLQDALEDLEPEDRDRVRAALEALSGRLQRLLDWLTSGQGPSREELEAMARRAGMDRTQNPRQALWITRRMLQELGFGQLEKLLAELRARLEAAGMSEAAIEGLMGVVRANREALAEQIGQQVGLDLARKRAEAQASRLTGDGDLMDRDLQDLGPLEVEQLRLEVKRLVARLRSRAALRQKRSKAGRVDPRRTLRANLRYGGVPIEIQHRRHKLKPRLTLICDVSTSMRPVAEFMLRLIYELSDQVAQARSFAFNADLEEISPAMAGRKAAEAVAEVLYAIPPGYYATDLGTSLDTFERDFREAVDRRTTVIVLGDGRNNHNDPRVDLLAGLRGRARRLVWLNPEGPERWGTGDSDMHRYAPHCDAVYPVGNLAQLAVAVDRLLAER
ncbi:MAG: VWA domain-containing protein [Caldilineae bacterium]|nr:VWA domain-containing protein [Chloroflexota bacterium]MCB9177255.1 VWA domain-containing protein [Caldilineae bacterium]